MFMTMNKKFDIKIFVVPVGACSYEKSWQSAVDLVSRKLNQRFGNVFEMKLIEIFSAESYLTKELWKGLNKKNIKYRL